ncbi:uncharacterized protein LOC113335664 [Papaver somniferum]|uniref:uncharacterized protein LOC113335664 n=1 Tax=Papaver somniferum TaxID=3469 RepID=UPI000E6FD042|nr:uncharacterized protein LOC113335664 [Papaver somniferum]
MESPVNKEFLLSRGTKSSPPIASATSSHANQVFPSPINSSSQPNLLQKESPVPADSSTPFSLLNSFPLNNKSLDSVKLAAQSLSDVINSDPSLSDDPCKFRSCSALSKLLFEFPADKASRDEVFSQIDPSFHVALDVLDSHRRVMLAEKNFESS